MRVYTIGFGTTNPAGMSYTREQLGRDVFGGGFGRGGGGFGGGGGFRRFLVADIPTLTAIAEQTGGTYHGAEDADQLNRVFSDLLKEVANAEAAYRGHLDPRGPRRSPCGRGGRRVDALEPVSLEAPLRC